MTTNINNKCRTCLKIGIKTFPLNKYARGCAPKRTYAQLLMEFAKFEFVAEQERNLPQELCKHCCRQLKNMFAFVRQAQLCNKKLLTMAKNKQLDCLQEQIIDLPSIAPDNSSCNIKVEKDTDVISSRDNVLAQDAIADKINIKNEEDAANNLFLKAEISDFTLNDESNCMAANLSERDSAEEDNQSSDFINQPCTTSDTTLDTDLNNTTRSAESSDPKLICPICKKLVSRRDNLIKHIRVQHGIRDPSSLLEKSNPEPKEQIYQCEHCPCKYTNKYVLLKHLKSKHDIEPGNTNETAKAEKKIIKCKFCDFIAKTYGALHYHVKAKHGTEDDKFKCNFCSFTRFKKFDLLGHIKQEHKEIIRNLRWEKANKMESKNNSANLQHNAKQLDNENIAEESETNNYSINLQESQIEENSSDDDIPLAQKVFKPKDIGTILDMENESSDEEFIRDLLNIKRRQTKSEPTKALVRSCDECGKIFKNKYALTAHKQRHIEITEDKFSLCPHCGNKYKRPKDLRGHIKKAHSDNPQTAKPSKPNKEREKRFLCTECSYVCINMALLRIHMNRHHTGEKPFKCDVCDLSFVVKFDLKTHYYLHTGERPFKCPICYKGFRHHTHMMKHKLIHSSVRPFNCLDCGKGFTKSYNLKVHKRTHLKQKSFE